MIFTAVDLPAPFSPSSASTSAARSSSPTPASACTPPKRFSTPMRASAGFDTAAGISEELCKLIHVRLVELEWLGHGRLAVRADLQGAHAPHRDARAGLAARLLGDDLLRGIDRRVTEIDRVPDGEAIDRARMHVAGHLRRQPEARHEHLADQPLIRD